MVHIGNPALMLSMLKKTGKASTVVMRVRSVSSSAEPLKLSWPSKKPVSVTVCNAAEEPVEKMEDDFRVAPYGMATLKLIY